MKPVRRKKQLSKVRLNTKQKRIRLGVICLVIILLFITLGKLFAMITTFRQPIDRSANKVKIWDGSTNINGVVVGGLTQVFSFNPQEKKLTVLTLPDETYLDLPFGFGKYPTRSIYELGQNETPNIGGRLLEETIKATLGMPIDGYIVLKGDFEGMSFTEVLERIDKNPFASISLLSSVESDFTKTEIFRLAWMLRRVRSDNQNVVNLADSSITKSLLLADGTRGYGIEQSKLDILIQLEAKDSRVTDEVLSVGIINATDHPKLAESASRIITNMGGRVTFTTSSEKSYEESFVVGRDSYTKTRMSQIFAPRCLVSKKKLFGLMQKSGCDINDPEIVSSRSDVTIVLGEDYFQKSNNK